MIVEKQLSEQERMMRMAIKIGQYYGLTEKETLERLQALEKKPQSNLKQERKPKENTSQK